MVKVAELMGHTERVLHLALSPDGSTLVSAGADETLRYKGKKMMIGRAASPSGSVSLG